VVRVHQIRLLAAQPQTGTVDRAVGVEEATHGASTVSRRMPVGYLAEPVVAGGEELPERLGIVGTGEPAGHADDRDLLTIGPSAPGAFRSRSGTGGGCGRGIGYGSGQMTGEVPDGRVLEHRLRVHVPPQPIRDLAQQPDGVGGAEAVVGKRPRRIELTGGHVERLRQAGDEPLFDLGGLWSRRGDRGLSFGLGEGAGTRPAVERAPLGHDRQVTGQVALATSAPHDLAARGLRHRAGTHELYGVDRQLAGLADRLPDRAQHLVRVGLGARAELLDQDQPLGAVLLDGERRAAVASECRVAPFDDLLHVLGVDVAPVDDDELLEPAGDEELAAAEEPEVSGPEVGPAVSTRNAGTKRLRGRLGAAPVPLGDARSTQPDLSDDTVGDGGGRLGIDHRDAHPEAGNAGAHQLHAVLVGIADLLGPVSRQGVGRESAYGGGTVLNGRRGQERRFRQPVAREEALHAEAHRPEALGEAPERRGPDRLGAVEGRRPRAEIEPVHLLR